MSRYLLDTNIISNVTKPAPSTTLLAWMAEQPDEDLLGVTLILSFESIVHAHVVHHLRPCPCRAAAAVGRIPLALSTPHPRRRCASWCLSPRTRGESRIAVGVLGEDLGLDALLEAGLLDQRCGEGGVLALGDHPADRVAAKDVEQ